jgi:hypothetical protein
MTSTQLFTNNAIALLQVSIDSSTATEIVLQPGLGEYFPQPVNPGDFFLVTLETIATPLYREIIAISNRIGDTLIIAPGGRAQENSSGLFPAIAWTAGETLVDHRITAGTIKQAFLQPVAAPAGGKVYEPTVVDPVMTQGVVTVPYSDYNRLNKFWVSMVEDTTGLSQALEVFCLVQGLLSTNSETVTYTETHRIGYNFSGSIEITLDVINKEITLAWMNTEPTKIVTVSVISI